MSFPRVYWPHGASSGGTATILGDAAHHLRQVLRLQPGARVGLFDGQGREWVGTVGAVTKQAVEVEGVVASVPAAESRVRVTLAIGVLKGEQMDSVVRDATMLGVAAIAPLRTEHVTVPAKAWQSGAAQARWQRVAIASATQCRRAVVPDVRAVTTLDASLADPAALRLICVEPALGDQAEGPASDDWRTGPAPSDVQVLVGPEGGWSRAEVAQALDAGATVVSLGPRTLRAETAPIVALTLVLSNWGW